MLSEQLFSPFCSLLILHSLDRPHSPPVAICLLLMIDQIRHKPLSSDACRPAPEASTLSGPDFFQQSNHSQNSLAVRIEILHPIHFTIKKNNLARWEFVMTSRALMLCRLGCNFQVDATANHKTPACSMETTPP